MASRHEQFKNQNYINLETFRKSGEGVKTPVWFVQERDSLYVRYRSGYLPRSSAFETIIMCAWQPARRWVRCMANGWMAPLCW